MTGTELAVARNGGAHLAAFDFSPSDIVVIKQKYHDMTPVEIDECMAIARARRLNPLTGQIHFVVRRVKREGDWVRVVTTQTGIDGFRVIAQRSKKYRGQVGPFWCNAKGEWVDVWLLPTPPFAAKVGVHHKDFAEPLWAVARFDSFVQKYPDGNPSGQWKTMPDVMIAKCAEAQALRKAFPDDLGGLYADEEMGQADHVELPEREIKVATRTDAVREKLGLGASSSSNAPQDGGAVGPTDAADAPAPSPIDGADGPTADPDRKTHNLLHLKLTQTFGYSRKPEVRAKKLDYCGMVVGRTIESTNELNHDEILIVVKAIERDYETPLDDAQ